MSAHCPRVVRTYPVTRVLTVLSVVGTRPEFVQASPLSRALRGRCREVIVHTGQHYDDEMSRVFLDEFEFVRPEHELGVGSGSHAEQTAGVILGTERVIAEEHPDIVVVRGDTNSGLGGALAAAKTGVRLAHVEAGVRAFDRLIPEEVNRIVIDHVSDPLFCPTDTAVRNLAAEGVTRGVHMTGDVTSDLVAACRPAAEARFGALRARLGIPHEHVIATVHRASNTDEPRALRAIVTALGAVHGTVVLPLHPRTAKALERDDLSLPVNVMRTPPLSYLDMLALLGHARLCITDSGGLQKEAYLLGIPCLTLRTNTEWWETVDAGWNALVGNDTETIVTMSRSFAPPRERPELFGDGRAAERIAELILG